MIDVQRILSLTIVAISPILTYMLLNRSRYFNYRNVVRHNTKKVMRHTGLSGDYVTAKTIDSLPGYHKTLVHTSIPYGKRGATEEIDIIYIHETGVYVFESKHNIGWVVGKESDKNWLNGYNGGHESKKIHNPIKENKRRIEAIMSLLVDVKYNQFKSMIVFSKLSELKGVSINSPYNFVFKRDELEKIMIEVTKKSTEVLTTEQIDNIFNAIKPYSKISEKIEEKHIEQIEE